MEKELCIRCGKQTTYDINTPITLRRYYIEGSGQLCEKCFYELYPVSGSLESMFDTNISQSVENENGGSEPPSLENMFDTGLGGQKNVTHSVDMTSQYRPENHRRTT